MPLWKVSKLIDCDYDEFRGFVIRAESSMRARELAVKEAKTEDKDIWLNPKTSSCRRIESVGAEKVILSDFMAG